MKINNNTRFLIVGLGLIGGSYAYRLKEKGYYVGAIDIDINSINYALENNIIDSGSSILEENYIKSFDIIIFALYPHTFVNWIKENQNLLKENALITDVTGVKKVVVNEIQNILRNDLDFVPSHPMAGRETSGVSHSKEVSFIDANYLVVPFDSNKKENIETIKELGHILGFKNVSTISVDEHDQMIAFLSQLTHCIAISLMNASDNEKLNKYSGDSFRDLTRIAKINENMWTELFLANKEQLIKEIELFDQELNKLKIAIKEEDEDAIKEMMKISTKRRKKFDIN